MNDILMIVIGSLLLLGVCFWLLFSGTVEIAKQPKRQLLKEKRMKILFNPFVKKYMWTVFNPKTRTWEWLDYASDTEVSNWLGEEVAEWKGENRNG